MKRLRLDQLFDALLPFFATLAALAIGGVMLLLMGANPLQGYAALLDGAFGSTNALADTLVKATPLLLVGLGICIAFRGGVINIGGEGQMILGALAGTVIGLTLPDAPGLLWFLWRSWLVYLPEPCGGAFPVISKPALTSTKFSARL